MTLIRNLPNALRPLQIISLSRSNAANLSQSGGAAPSAGQKVLTNVAMSGQEQSNWCWSAATQTVCGWAGDVKDQVDVATAHVSHNGRALTCAAASGSDTNGQNCDGNDNCAADCNDPHILSVVLREQGRFKDYITQSAAPSFQQVQDQINLNVPIPCRIAWPDGGGHFVVVMGWTIDANGNPLVHVLDPDRAASGQPVVEIIRGFNDFVTAYTLSGSAGQVNYSYEVQ